VTIQTTSDPAQRDCERATSFAGNAVLESLGGGVLVVGLDQTVVYTNALAKAWLPNAGDVSRALEGVRFSSHWDGWSSLLRAVIQDGTIAELPCLMTLSGQSMPTLFHLRCTPLQDGNGVVLDYCVILVAAVVVPPGMGAELEVSQRLTSLGKLTSRVAHELNNPLDGILRYINLALRSADAAPDTNLKSYLSESRIGLMRMVQIVGDLLEYSRLSDDRFDAMPVDEVVRQAVMGTTSAAKAAGVGVTIDVKCHEMPETCGSRLFQVCSNLVKNAIDATPDGGGVRVSLDCVNEEIVLCIEDDGVGLPEPPERVFEPFYTTKDSGKGTGIGLAICKDFVEGMGGTIEVCHRAPHGAVFRVVIPVCGLSGSNVTNKIPLGNTQG